MILRKQNCDISTLTANFSHKKEKKSFFKSKISKVGIYLPKIVKKENPAEVFIASFKKLILHKPFASKFQIKNQQKMRYNCMMHIKTLMPIHPPLCVPDLRANHTQEEEIQNRKEFLYIFILAKYR